MSAELGKPGQTGGLHMERPPAPSIVPPQRYLLNLAAKIAHDRENLSEECNTDAITKRRQADEIPEGFKRCKHCMGEEEAKP